MFNVIIDTREQKPWNFTSSSINDTVVDTVKTGDYTIQAHEHNFTIERKNSTGEIARNIFEKRFKDTLQRMSDMSHAYIIFEFSYEDVLNFPIGSGIPKRKWGKIRMTANFMNKTLAQYMINYNVPIIFAGDRENAQRIAQSLMKEYYEKYS